MKKYSLHIVFVMCFAIGIISAQKLTRSSSPEIVTGWNTIDINSINATISYDGVFADYRRTSSGGLIWPKGLTKTSIFTSGLWIIGKHKPTGQLRTAVMDYGSEYQPGKIISTFNTTTNAKSAADDPAKPEYRLYKTIRGMKSNDQQNWPVHLGAPYNDIDNNGTYNSAVDEPVRWGDQMLWTVANDVDSLQHTTMGKTKPLGIELQSTFFSYAISGVLNNTVFLRYKMINKSDAEYESVYVAYWSDTDLGDANDDMTGVDTVRQFGFYYNGDNDDGGTNGYGLNPPAAGFVMLQGPKVHTGATSDTALFEGKKLPGYQNQTLYSHSVFIGGGIWSDPPLGSTDFARQAYNYMRGRIGTTGQPYNDPVKNAPSRFVFSGDPVGLSGWTQTAHGLSSADMRSMISSGPFTFAPGDTQEVVFAYVIARGSSNLNSIIVLRNYADELHQIFRSNFSALPPSANGARLYYEPLPLTKTFGKVNVGENSDTIRFQFANVGNDTLKLTIGSFTNASFVHTSAVQNPISVPPLKTYAIPVIYKPLAAGAMNDSLVITTNDSSNLRLVITVSGAGANVLPAATGSIYATNTTKLYTLAPTTGAATFVTDFEGVTPFSFHRLAVRPSTKELISASTAGMYRISATGPAFIPSSFTLSGYSFTGGLAFYNDTLLMFAADTMISRLNIRTGVVEMVHKFTSLFRIRSMAYHAAANEVYYSINSFVNQPDTADAIYKIHLGTKTITRLGRVKIGNRIRALLCDVNGKLYGLVDSTIAFDQTTHLVTINTSTGAGTMIGSTGQIGMIALAMDPSSPASVRPVNAQIPRKYSLEQNYPNPFNPSTTIRYSVPTESPVTLSIFNILGKKVTELVNEHHAPGNYSAEWNGRDRSGRQVSTGVYYYTIEAGEFRETKKMLLLK